MKISTRMTVGLDDTVEQIVERIKQDMERRSYLAANELRNSALQVLRGQRSGRRYRVPSTKKHYTASAPGEPPAVRTGVFRLSWQPTAHKIYGSYISRIESDARTDNGRHNLGEILERGTSRMAPRPYEDRILEKAEPKIVKIYAEPYE